MLKLCGFAASNYYNKVKLALLEKGIPFEEELAWVGQFETGSTFLQNSLHLLHRHVHHFIECTCAVFTEKTGNFGADTFDDFQIIIAFDFETSCSGSGNACS